MAFSFRRTVTRFVKWSVPAVKGFFLGTGGGHPDYKSIPVVINNFNRLSMLKKLIAGLEQRGYGNIHIIDNGSSYPPLLEWYATCGYTVYLLNRNVGHLSVWETGIYKQFAGTYFAYTDSDLELHPECPDDFMEHFVGLLKRHPRALKAGFSLCIDDIPDCFSNKKAVVEWEKQFWKHKVRGEQDAYWAPIDTTFAVYKPYFKGEVVDFTSRYIRSGFPYSARHLPWYVDSGNLVDEEKYYLSHIRTSTHWSEQAVR